MGLPVGLKALASGACRPVALAAATARAAAAARDSLPGGTPGLAAGKPAGAMPAVTWQPTGKLGLGYRGSGSARRGSGAKQVIAELKPPEYAGGRAAEAAASARHAGRAAAEAAGWLSGSMAGRTTGAHDAGMLLSRLATCAAAGAAEAVGRHRGSVVGSTAADEAGMAGARLYSGGLQGASAALDAADQAREGAAPCPQAARKPRFRAPGQGMWMVHGLPWDMESGFQRRWEGG